jgi:type IV pilus assembly protein PilE
MVDVIFCKARGYTLIELVAVVVILGIRASLAIPSYLRVQARAKGCEAKGMLKAALILEKAYLNQHGRYSSSLDEIGFVQVPLVTDDPPGKARYRITIPVATREMLRVTATAVVDFDGHGRFSVWPIDESGNILETFYESGTI